MGNRSLQGSNVRYCGGNLASLSFLRHPRSMVAYWQHCMFTWQLASGNGLPQVQLHDLLPVEEITDVTILPTSGNFIPWIQVLRKTRCIFP